MPLPAALRNLTVGLWVLVGFPRCNRGYPASEQTAVGFYQTSLQSLNQVLQTLRNPLELNKTFETALIETRRLLQSNRATIMRYLPQQALWRVEAFDGSEPKTTGWALPDRQQPLIDQIKAGQVVRLHSLPPEAMHSFMPLPGRWLFIPLSVKGEVWGCLSLMRGMTLPPWQNVEVEVAQTVANQLAIAIHQAELYQQVITLNLDLEAQVQKRTRQLQQLLSFEALLKRITDKVRDSLDEHHILTTVVQELTEGLGVVRCHASLYDHTQNTSTICYEYTTSFLSTQGQILAMAAEPEIYQQLLQGTCFQFCQLFPDPMRGRPALLVCPIRHEQAVLGDLCLANDKDYYFKDGEQRLVEQVANQCAIAIRQARLYKASQAQVVELERLNHLKDDFLSTVSHELRSPMANIKMATQMLAIVLQPLGLFESEDGRTKRYLQILQSECQRETNLINDLLDLARLDTEETLVMTAIDVAAWLTGILEPFRERTQVQQQALRLEVAPGLPTLTTNSSYLERILHELLHNACKYTPSHGMIAVHVACVEDVFMFQVRNSGIDLDEHELAHLFDRFYRVPHHDPWKHGGTGLGLALVKKLVERLGATIQVECKSNWITFTLRLSSLSKTLNLEPNVST